MTAAPLTGLAIGDALGMPFETRKASDPTLLNWDETYGSSEYHKLGPGQWTDDTQMSMALGRSLIQGNSYLGKDVAAAYLAWYTSGDCRGIGGSTRKAMERLRSGASYEHSGIAGAEGNGTAMRAAPIGMFFHQAVTLAGQVAGMDACITHVSFDTQDGSRAVAVAIAHLVSGQPASELLPVVLDNLHMDSKLRSKLKQCHLKPVGEVSAHVIPTITAAFHAFLTTGSYIEAVTKAIRFGGDTDSVGAITGALAGAYYGYESIPTYYLDGLEKAWEIRELEARLLEGVRMT